MKTARFADVVKQCGEPEPHLMLIEPAKDRELQAAIKAKRVMTVFQDTVGTKADRGVVGFEAGPARQFLIFPKALRAFEGKQIIGIKYELWSIKEPPKSQRAGPVKPPVKKAKPAPAKLPANVFAFPSMKDPDEDEVERRDADGATPKKKSQKKHAPISKSADQAEHEKPEPQSKAKARPTRSRPKPAKSAPEPRAKSASKRTRDEKEERAAATQDTDAVAEIARIKQQVRAALDALEEGKQIPAFNILKRIVGD
jgi:hypothetical protein